MEPVEELPGDSGISLSNSDKGAYSIVEVCLEEEEGNNRCRSSPTDLSEDVLVTLGGRDRRNSSIEPSAE